MKNKVLYISSWPIFNSQDGILIPFIYEQVVALSKEVDAFYVDISFLPFHKWIFLPNTQIIFRVQSSNWNDTNVNHYRIILPKVSTRLTNREPFEDLYWAASFISSKIKNSIGQLNLIHCHTALDLGAFALGLSKRLNIPLLYQEHSAPFEMHLKDDKRKKFVLDIMNHADQIVAVGPFLEKRMSVFSPSSRKKIVVIPEMINTEIFRLVQNKLNLKRINLISIGGLVERKGYNYLVQAVRVLIDNGVNVYLVIIGEGKYRNSLESLIRNLGLSDHVILTGHLDKKSISNYIKQANIYVHSSLRETFGIAPTEALLMGRPVVSTKCEGPEYYIDETNGLLVNCKDSEALAKGVETIIDNWSNYKGATLRNSVEEKFGEQAFLQKMLKQYLKIINE